MIQLFFSPQAPQTPPRERLPRNQSGNAPRFRASLVSALFFALIVAPLTYGAFRAFPASDDGWLWLHLKELGPESVRQGMGDRPLAAWLWAKLAERHLLFPVSVVLYAFTWFGTGLITLSLWGTMFPNLKVFGPLAGCIAMAPVLVETQAVLINPILTGHFGPVVAYATVLLLWRRNSSLTKVVVLSLIGSTAIATVCLISEYAVLATWAAASLMLLVNKREPDRAKIRRGTAALFAMICVATAAYVTFHFLASENARPVVRPEHQVVAHGFRRLLEVPLRIPFSLWTAGLGAFLTDLGDIVISRRTIVGIIYGTVFALVALGIFRQGLLGGAAHRGQIDRRNFLFLLAVIVGSLVPIIFMSQSPGRNFSSRTWLPLLPLSACLTTFVVATFPRDSARLWIAVGGFFLCGYLSANMAAAAISGRNDMARLGVELRRMISPSGLTVAILSNAPTNSFVGEGDPPIHCELTARLTAEWSADERGRFVALSEAKGWLRPTIDTNNPNKYATGYEAAINIRGWTRQGPVSRILWVSMTSTGGFDIFIQ